MRRRLQLLLLAGLASLCGAFYLPFTLRHPGSFCEPSWAGQEGSKGCQSQIELFVNRLDTVESALLYEYDDFDFCQNATEKRPSENLGQVLFGERIASSPYKFTFNKIETCKKVCMKSYNPEKAEDISKLAFLTTGMLLDYQHHWIVDNMPVTWCYEVEDNQKYCNPGFPIGSFVNADQQPKGACVISTEFNKENMFYLFNHVDIEIMYHSGKDENWPGARLVAATLQPRRGFCGPYEKLPVEMNLVHPFGNSSQHVAMAGVYTVIRETQLEVPIVPWKPTSYRHTNKKDLTCDAPPPMEIPAVFSKKLDVIYTYSVRFTENNNIKWASRWDYIFDSIPPYSFQWFSMMISPVIVLFLSGMVAMILLWVLRKDIARYNQKDSPVRGCPEGIWVEAGSGRCIQASQEGRAAVCILGPGDADFHDDAYHLVLCVPWRCFASRQRGGALMTCAFVLWALLGTPAGYVSARVYKTFRGEKWKTNVLLTALLCPGVVFADYFIMNLMLWVRGSATISLGTLVAILAMWFGISVPLTFIGAYFGFKEKPIELPVLANQNPRLIPKQSFSTKPLLGIIMGGVLPFGCIFTQLFYILNIIWHPQMYYRFGFLFIVFIILLITCSEATVLLCYFHLRAEDYHWWWRSFLTSGFMAFYLSIYAIYYFFSRVWITETASIILYFGYTAVMVLIFFLFTGTVGFFACFWFVSKIYSIVKVDGRVCP